MFARIQLVVLAIAGVYLGSFYLANAKPLQARAECARTYTVLFGDTCDKISATQNVSTYQLATVNSAAINPACDNLFIGEVLCLGLLGEDCTIVHVVLAGDTCGFIAANAGITFATLRANNPNVDAGCTNIYPDEVLCTAPATTNSTK